MTTLGGYISPSLRKHSLQNTITHSGFISRSVSFLLLPYKPLRPHVCVHVCVRVCVGLAVFVCLCLRPCLRALSPILKTTIIQIVQFIYGVKKARLSINQSTIMFGGKIY